MRLLIIHTFHYFISLMLNISFSVSLFSITLFFSFCINLYSRPNSLFLDRKKSFEQKLSSPSSSQYIYAPAFQWKKGGRIDWYYMNPNPKAYNASLLQLRHSNILTLGSILFFFVFCFLQYSKIWKKTLVFKRPKMFFYGNDCFEKKNTIWLLRIAHEHGIL